MDVMEFLQALWPRVTATEKRLCILVLFLWVSLLLLAAHGWLQAQAPGPSGGSRSEAGGPSAAACGVCQTTVRFMLVSACQQNLAVLRA